MNYLEGGLQLLVTLFIAEHGLALHKELSGMILCMLCLHYGWHPNLLPSHCICDYSLTIICVLSREVFLSIWHNEIRDLMADLMAKVCYGVRIEPGLPPVTKELLTSNWRTGKMRLAMASWARIFGREIDNALSLMYGFSTPLHEATVNTPLSQCYRYSEKLKICRQLFIKPTHTCYSGLYLQTHH